MLGEMSAVLRGVGGGCAVFFVIREVEESGNTDDFFGTQCSYTIHVRSMENIFWVVPLPCNSHHQDYSIFRLGDPYFKKRRKLLDVLDFALNIQGHSMIFHYIYSRVLFHFLIGI